MRQTLARVFGPIWRVLRFLLAPIGRGLRFAFKPVAKALISIPFVRRRYARRLLDTIENSPPSTLPPQLRELRTALQRVPKPRRLELLEQALANPEQAQQQQEIIASNRQLRRMAGKKGGPPQQFRRPPGKMR